MPGGKRRPRTAGSGGGRWTALIGMAWRCGLSEFVAGGNWRAFDRNLRPCDTLRNVSPLANPPLRSQDSGARKEPVVTAPALACSGQTLRGYFEMKNSPRRSAGQAGIVEGTRTNDLSYVRIPDVMLRLPASERVAAIEVWTALFHYLRLG